MCTSLVVKGVKYCLITAGHKSPVDYAISHDVALVSHPVTSPETLVREDDNAADRPASSCTGEGEGCQFHHSSSPPGSFSQLESGVTSQLPPRWRGLHENRLEKKVSPVNTGNFEVSFTNLIAKRSTFL